MSQAVNIPLKLKLKSAILSHERLISAVIEKLREQKHEAANLAECLVISETDFENSYSPSAAYNYACYITKVQDHLKLGEMKEPWEMLMSRMSFIIHSHIA